MNTLRNPAAGVAAVLMTAFFAAPASARCVAPGAQPANAKAGLFARAKWPAATTSPSKAQATGASDADVASAAQTPTPVGLWYAQFRVDGQLVDDGYDMWLSDGMEVLNDSVAPSTGAVCLGIWTQTGPNTYTLKHPSWTFDETGANLTGIVMISETITLSVDGNSYKGKGSTDIYDLTGNPVAHFDFAIAADRITSNFQPTAGGIPGLPLSILNR
jgi:hypothetical protein